MIKQITILKSSVLGFVLMSFVVLQAQDVSLDKKLGAENDQIVKQQMGIYEDSAMTAYVAAVGNRLVSQIESTPFDYQFLIVDTPIPNAFALPGGYIYVTRGVLALTISEDELAGILGHEINHVEKRHSIKQMKTSILPGILSLPGNIVGVVDPHLGATINAPINAGGSLFMASYSRKHETEADVEGIELMVKAGYDPNALGAVLARLSEEIKVLTGEEEQKSYQSSHPYTPDRVDKINKTITKVEINKKAPISGEFPMPLDGLCFGENPINGFFEENKFIQPTMDFAIELPKKWKYQNMPVALMAVNEAGSSMIMMTVEDTVRMLKDIADDFSAEMLKQAKISPRSNKGMSVNDIPARILTYDDASNVAQPLVFFVMWLKKDEVVYRIVGVGPKPYEEGLIKSASSFRRLTTEEKNATTISYFKAEKIEEEQSLLDFMRKNSSEKTLEKTAFYNGFKEDALLKEGKYLKVLSKKGLGE